LAPIGLVLIGVGHEMFESWIIQMGRDEPMNNEEFPFEVSLNPEMELGRGLKHAQYYPGLIPQL